MDSHCGRCGYAWYSKRDSWSDYSGSKPFNCLCLYITLVVHNTMWNIKSSESSPLKVTYAPTYMCIYWYVCMYHTYTPGLLVTMYYHTRPCVADPPGTSWIDTSRTCSDTVSFSLVTSISREPTPSDTMYEDWTNVSMIAVYTKKKAGLNATWPQVQCTTHVLVWNPVLYVVALLHC